MSPTATRIHVVLVGALAIAGIGTLLFVARVALLSDNAYSRDMGLLSLGLTAPIWLLGLVAGAEAVSVFRGRAITRVRAVVWALVLLAAGGLLAHATGLAEVLVLVVTDPRRIGLEWPAIIVLYADYAGASVVYLDQPIIWLVPLSVGFGIASLTAVGFDGRARQAGTTP